MQASSSHDVPSENVFVCLAHCSPCAAVAVVSSVFQTCSKSFFSADFAIPHTIIKPSILPYLLSQCKPGMLAPREICLQQESAHCRDGTPGGTQAHVQGEAGHGGFQPGFDARNEFAVSHVNIAAAASRIFVLWLAISCLCSK